MKRLLLLGGMTPDATVLYYNTINRIVREKLGGRNNATLHMYSANLEEMVGRAFSGDWDSFAQEYIDAMTPLTSSVDGVVVCAIIAHKVAQKLAHALAPTGVPLLHIGDCIAQSLKSQQPDIQTVGILGPKVTMQGADDPDFFIGRLQNQENGFTVIVPEGPGVHEEIDRGMFEEVAKGAAAVTAATKAMFVQRARELVQRGAKAIILGSTDLGFVVKQEDLGDEVLVIEPGSVHAEQVAKWALSE